MKKIINHLKYCIRNRKLEDWKNVEFKGRNIYQMENFGEEMTWIHKTLKRIFIIPTIIFLEWYFEGKLKKELDDVYQFRKLNAFNTAYTNALEDWNYLYRPFAYETKHDPELLNGDVATKRLELLKDMYMTICSGDTAYLEFHNLLMDNIFQQMSQVDNNHIFYTSKNINDYKYFLITDKLKDGKIELKQVKR